MEQRPPPRVHSALSLHVLRRDLVQRAADQHQRDRRPEVADLELDLEAGRSFSVDLARWYRLVGGKIAEHRASRNDLALLQQLGAVAGPQAL
ncbi:MAG: hypothetical protein QOF00_1332 [Pseudonocardiales bacterium]|nr:hypothetical protein [Pseudonocardiales bacterium]